MKKRILAMLLTAAMVVTAFPATAFAAQSDNSAVSTVAEDEAADAKVGIDIAPEATGSTSVPNHTNPSAMVDDDTTTCWNTWGADEEEYPAEVTLTWDTARKVNSMQVIWWADTSNPDAAEGVTFPTEKPEAQYLNAEGEWVSLGEVGIDVITSSNNGLKGNNQNWNEVVFEEEIETTAIRMLVKRSGSGTNGVGIAEWEVYGMPEVAKGDNIATLATASAQHTNVWYIEETSINDGELATADSSTSWNSWGAEDEYPLWVELDWGEQMYEISSLQVMWWSDGGGVVWPSSATLQYWNTRSEKWVDVTGFMDETGVDVDSIGVKYGTEDAASDAAADYVNGANAYWNGIILDKTVKTTKLRMLVDRGEVADANAGIGISEWQVFGKEYEAGVGSNVALNAKASANSANEPVIRINDGVLARNYDTSWNTWSAGEPYPVSAVLTWDAPQVLKSARVMWWADNATLAASGNVTFPKSAIVEYYDHNTEEWVQITGMTNELGETTDNIGVLWGEDGNPQPLSGSADGYTNGGNRYWNEVTFPTEIKTTKIRLTVDRNGTGSNGIGAGEFEVYGEEMTADWGEIISANIEGEAITTKDQILTYVGQSLPVGLEGATYAWSVAEGSEDKIQINGAADQETVEIKTVSTGKATLNLDVTMGDVTRSASKEIQIDGITDIETYVTNTAAGIAPILPKKVVANGITFDDATPSASGRNGVDFGETFDAKLVDVTWEEVDPALYAADQIGKTFTVDGTVVFGNETWEAKAEITVQEKMVAPVANSTVTFENVQLTDNFWLPKQQVNAVNSLNKGIYEIEQASGGEPNYVNAIAKLNGEEYSGHQGYVFQDSDIYKSIEAISYTLSVINDSEDPEMIAQKAVLEEKLEYWIYLIEQVQYADGYIGTHFTLRSTQYAGGGGPGTHRWRYFANHEMYNAGHFYEAAVAYTRYREGIGDPDYSLYVVAKRSADQIVELFGPGGTRNEVPGHEEVELALVKLAKLVEEYEGAGTGQKYLDTVQLMINRRGETNRDSGYQGGEYSQDNGSIKEVTEAVGHAVRACYFYAGVTDMATLLPEGNEDREAYLKTMDTIWDSVALTKTYITGGIGVSTHGEDFGDPYELPNNLSYCETCAAIALANWNQRMNLVHEDAKYADVVERTLYNAILVGTNLEGNLFYYSSRLEVSNGNGRSEWFGCACCPPNLMRTIAKLSEYMYTVHADDLFINMYIGSNGNVNVDGTNVNLVQTTEYPWDGAIKLEVTPDADKEFTMNIRIPGWVADQYDTKVDITVNGEAVTAEAEKGYVAVTRTWKAGDVVMIDIPMEIRMTEAHPEVKTNEGKIALERGPIVYCMEKAGNAQINDNNNFNPLNFVIPRDAELTATYNEELLNGVVEITGDVLYNDNGTLVDAKLQAVPYYAWNNRGDNGVQGQNSSTKMLIWTNAVGDPTPKNLPLVASYDMTVADGKLVDTTGNGFDATLQNFAETDITTEGEDAVLVFDGTDNYVELPAGMIETEQFAIEATFKTSTTNYAWLWCLGTEEGSPADNYVFVSPRFSADGIRGGIKYGEEILYPETAVVADDTYTTIKVVFNKGNLTLFVDDEQVSSIVSEYSIQELLAAGNGLEDICGYIGKSLWPDPYLTATMTQFNVYASAPVDYSELQDRVDEIVAMGLVEEDWSTKSWTAFEAAMEAAEAALANDSASQSLLDAALENLEAAFAALEERTPETEGNIALIGTPSADYTNVYDTPVTNMNDDAEATSSPNTSWNCWGGATFPVGVYYHWDQEYTIDSMEVMWWADGGGVQFPGSAQVQYLDENGEWVTITGMTNELGEETDYVGVVAEGTNGANSYWNEVKFAEPVVTTAIKMVIERQEGHTGSTGVGISEWRVFQVYEEPQPGDKAALQAAVDALAELKADDYTAESWAALEEAKAEAEKTLAADGALQTTIDRVLAELEAAVDALVLINAPELPYEDVTKDDWFYNAVYYTYVEKIMTGMDEDTFGPYESLSRAQFALILYRIEGEPEVDTDKTFLDIVGDEWYGKAVLWAAEAGIVTGYENGCYGPVDLITREQMAVMMYRYAKYLGQDVDVEADYSKFVDADTVSEFATEGMSWAIGSGIITGKEEGTKIDPQNVTARCEAATIIQRFME